MNEIKKAKRIVLGEGEVVGHKHILTSDENISFVEEDDSITFMLNSMGVLTHDEHAKMVFPPGKYVSYNQVEFNPFDQSVSRVFD
jgi:hypothetical protein